MPSCRPTIGASGVSTTKPVFAESARCGILSRDMFTGNEIVEVAREVGVTHFVWVPDKSIGIWEAELEAAAHLRLVRVCREGEAWPLAAGLLLGGARPWIAMQTTGFFESGDAMRNVVYDLKLPVFAIIGARNWLTKDSSDSAKSFAEPILQAWGIDYQIIESPDQKTQLAEHYRACQESANAGAVLMAEGGG